MNSAFFTLHTDLPREGPGEAADVAWAAQVAEVRPGRAVLDACSGPGADIAALLEATPGGHVTAIDAQAHFITAVQGAWSDPPVTARVGDAFEPEGAFDFIWCAGAVYFKGVEAALSGWRKVLRPGGAIAFSEPCFFVDAPSEAARAYWEGYQAGTEADIVAAARRAGFKTIETRKVSDAAWAAYHDPMAARIAALRPGATADLHRVLDEAEAEIADYQTIKHETGYLLAVVRPDGG